MGDPSKAKEILGWEPEISARTMCEEMVESDYELAYRQKILRDNGVVLPISIEG